MWSRYSSRHLTAELLLRTSTLKEDIKLKRPVEVLLHGKEVATGVDFVRKLENECGVWEALCRVLVRSSSLLCSSYDSSLDYFCGCRHLSKLFVVSMYCISAVPTFSLPYSTGRHTCTQEVCPTEFVREIIRVQTLRD